MIQYFCNMWSNLFAFTHKIRHSSSLWMTHLIFCRPMDTARPLCLIPLKDTVKAGPGPTPSVLLQVSVWFRPHWPHLTLSHPLPIKLVFWLNFSVKAPPPIWLHVLFTVLSQNERYHLKRKCPKCMWGDLAHGQRFSACMRMCVCLWVCWGQGYQSGMLL